MQRHGVKRIEYIRGECDDCADILSLLQGKIFHVTRREYLASILADGQIDPNPDGLRPSTFGAHFDSFFRKRGYVSLFDYHPEPTEEIASARRKCRPLMPATHDTRGVAIFSVVANIYPDIVPWTLARDEATAGEMFVPHVECGFHGPIPLTLVEDEIVCLRLVEEREGFLAALREGRRRSRTQDG